MSAVKKIEKKSVETKPKSSIKKKIPVRKIESEEPSFREEVLDFFGSNESAEKNITESKLKEEKFSGVEDIWMDTEESEKEAGTNPDSYTNYKLQQPKNSSKKIKERSLHMYRKISVSFVLLTAILIGVIAYYSFVKVHITLALKEQSVSNNLVADISNEGAAAREGAISGLIKKSLIEQSKIYDATGSNNIGEEAVGQVKITNNYDKNQPLVATTRLLAADGTLFRLTNTVNVPAGGTVMADIYADKPVSGLSVAPTRFTIPGLWAGLQDKIYAESSDTIKYQAKAQKFIQQADIDNAIADLKNSLLASVESQNNYDQSKYNQAVYEIDQNSIKSEVDSKVNDQKEKFTVKLSANVLMVAFYDGEIKKLAIQKLKDSLTDDQSLTSFNQDKVIYSLSNVDSSGNSASVDVSFAGTALPSESIVSKDKLVGLDEAQIRQYLSGIPEIASFDISFSPPFIKTAYNRIEIEIKK